MDCIDFLEIKISEIAGLSGTAVANVRLPAVVLVQLTVIEFYELSVLF